MSGNQTVLMDQRGRISFPAAYRAAIGELLFISPDQKGRGYLIVRSEEGYKAELKRIEQECIEDGLDDEDTSDEVRDYAKDTSRIPPDKNGRITLVSALIEYAGLSDKVVVIGVGEYAELWDEDRLTAYEKQRAELRARRRAKKDREKAARLAALAEDEA